MVVVSGEAVATPGARPGLERPLGLGIPDEVTSLRHHSWVAEPICPAAEIGAVATRTQNTALRKTTSNQSTNTTTMPSNPNSRRSTEGISGPLTELRARRTVSRWVNVVMLVPLEVTIQFAR
jgi:hypothetical protein